MRAAVLWSLTALTAVNGQSLKVSWDARCGPEGGKTTCKGSNWGNCCSQYGWCGRTSDYCGKGCNPLYGLCDQSPTTLSTATRTSVATPSATVKVSKNSRCGYAYGATEGFSCMGSKYGNCCSQYSYCGSSVDYCGKGCQGGFGKCNPVSSSMSSMKQSSTSSSPTRSSTASSTLLSSKSTQSSNTASPSKSFSSTTSTLVSSSSASSTPASSSVASSSSVSASPVSSAPASSTPASASVSSSPVASSTPASSTPASSTPDPSSVASSTPVSSSAASSTLASSTLASSTIVSSTPASSSSSSSSSITTPTPSAAPCVTNYLTNGGFETGSLQPWIAEIQDKSPLAVTGSAAHTGQFGMLLTANPDDYLNDVRYRQSGISVPDGTTLTLSLYFRLVSSGSCTISLIWDGTPYPQATLTDAVNVWQQVNAGTITAWGSSPHTLELYMVCNAVQYGEPFYNLDDIALVSTSSPSGQPVCGFSGTT